MMPSHISWQLAWTDMFYLFQNLHTAICAKDTLRRVIFAGSNPTVCQNLQRVWQQFLEDVAIESGWVTEVDLIPTDTAIASHQHYVNPVHCAEGLCSGWDDSLVQLQLIPPLKLQGIESGVLLVAEHFCVWVQLQLVTVRVGDAAIAPGYADLSARWQATLVLDRSLMQTFFQVSDWAAIAPFLPQLSPSIEQAQTGLRAFWKDFLQLTQGVSAQTGFDLPPQALPCLFKPLFQQMPLGLFQLHLDGSFISMNPAFCQFVGYSQAELLRLDLQAITVPEDFRIELEMIQQIVQYEEQRVFEKRYRRADGSSIWAEVRLSLVGEPQAEESFLMGFVTDLSDRRQIEAERLNAFQEIQQRQEQATLLNNIAVRIRSAIDLPTMLQNAAAELNHALHSDRVVIYQLTEDGGGCCVSEAVNPQFVAMQGQNFGADCIPPPYLEAYRTGRLWSLDEVSQATLTACHQEMLDRVQVKSMIATGILSMDDALLPDRRRLWGLLAIHQCDAARTWTPADLQLVEAVANQLAIALEQTKLLNRLTRYTYELEDRVRERTYSLERSLKFEQFIRSLTECLYQDFDENRLFQTMVRGLVSTLGVDVCLVSRYNSQDHTLKVKFEAFSNQIPATLSLIGQQFAIAQIPSPSATSSPDEKTYYFNGTLDVSSIFLNLALLKNQSVTDASTQCSQLVRPIMGVDHELGMVLVMQLATREFEAAEVALIEQATNYCAIALRQAHLYRQEHEQRLSAEYLRSFLEQSIDVYVEYDHQRRYIAINPMGCTLLGRPQQDIIGKTNQDLNPIDGQALDQMIHQALVTAEKVFVDHEVVLPQGPRVFESVYAPITSPDGVVQRVIGVCRDITDFKQQWQLLEQQNHQLTETTRLKQEFVATTSHELRTPLTAILGFSNVLMQGFAGQLNHRQQEYVERIYSSGEHLLELINDILDLSRLEAGRMDLNLQLLYVADLCEAVTGLLQDQAESRGLKLEIDLAPEVEWMIADPRRLKQMLLNLLVNAIKFTPQGSVGLKIYCDTSMRSPNSALHSSAAISPRPKAQWIYFLVWDTGIGISEVDQRSLFQPFSQVDSSLERKHQGSGLGLVITQKLAELHGGRVSLQSTVGKGTQLTIALPLRTIDYKRQQNGVIGQL
jgi:PAS domain S-box-containing protein